MINIIRNRIREHLLTCNFPMKTTSQIARHVTGKYVDSTDREYIKVYLTLEKMVSEGEIYCTGVKNGGNVYMSCDRVRPPFVNTSAESIEAAKNLDNTI